MQMEKDFIIIVALTMAAVMLSLISQAEHNKLNAQTKSGCSTIETHELHHAGQ